jgi:hypothetical protein
MNWLLLLKGNLLDLYIALMSGTILKSLIIMLYFVEYEV